MDSPSAASPWSELKCYFQETRSGKFCKWSTIGTYLWLQPYANFPHLAHLVNLTFNIYHLAHVHTHHQQTPNEALSLLKPALHNPITQSNQPLCQPPLLCNLHWSHPCLPTGAQQSWYGAGRRLTSHHASSLLSDFTARSVFWSRLRGCRGQPFIFPRGHMRRETSTVVEGSTNKQIKISD